MHRRRSPAVFCNCLLHSRNPRDSRVYRLSRTLALFVILMLLVSCSAHRSSGQSEDKSTKGADAASPRCDVDRAAICSATYLLWKDLTPPIMRYYGPGSVFASESGRTGIRFALRLPSSALLAGYCSWNPDFPDRVTGQLDHLPQLDSADAHYLRTNGFCSAARKLPRIMPSLHPQVAAKVSPTQAAGLCGKFYSDCWDKGWLESLERGRPGSRTAGDHRKNSGEYWSNEITTQSDSRVELSCLAVTVRSTHFSGVGRLTANPNLPKVARANGGRAALAAAGGLPATGLASSIRCDQFTEPLLIGWY